ncbi:MAG: phosphotransferase family protein [Nitrospiria bacterium]
MRVEVVDRFGVRKDPKMSTLPLALNPEEVRRQFQERLQAWMGNQTSFSLRTIRVIRYKPGRRCLIEYDLDRMITSQQKERLTLIGKIKSRSFGKSGYRLLKSFWDTGFQTDKGDGISVPEPVGTIPAFRMWLQRKVPGKISTDLLAKSGAESLVQRIAEAAYKLQEAGVSTHREHSISDEIRILHEHLPKVTKQNRRWTERIDRLLEAADRLGRAIPTPCRTGIHRDFYADQVIVDDARLTLIDFDLYCLGDPGLDIGNFIAHITEQSLRLLGDPKALKDQEQAMEERYVELRGKWVRPSVKTYTTLTLLRHIYLSTLFPERRTLTAPLLELCEERLKVTR